MFINNIHPRGNCNTYTEMLKTTNAHASYRCEQAAFVFVYLMLHF